MTTDGVFHIFILDFILRKKKKFNLLYSLSIFSSPIKMHKAKNTEGRKRIEIKQKKHQMMGAESETEKEMEDGRGSTKPTSTPTNRPSLKTHFHFNNYHSWKHKVRSFFLF
jgi:hypothetical protein